MYKLLASVLVALQATDGLMTMWATKRGFVEQNHLMAPIADTWMLPVLKIGVSLVIIAVCFPLARRFSQAIIGGFAVGNTILMLVVGLNFVELMSV